MKRYLRKLFGRTTELLLLAALAVAILLVVGQQPLSGSGKTAAEAPATGQTPQVVTFQSPLQPATPTPTPFRASDLEVVSKELVSSGPYRSITWSPDGKKALISKQFTQYLLQRQEGVSTEGLPAGIAFGTTTGLGDLWLLDLESGQERLLLEQMGRYAWSPDSTRVAYLMPTESEGTAGELRVLDMTTGKNDRLVSVDFLGSDYSPYWLPTGEIVYVRDGYLWTIEADGKNEKQLAGLRRFSRLAAEQGKEVYLEDPDALAGFHFSPDGRRVAYKTMGGEPERAIAFDLWLADADGSNARLITRQAEGSYYEWSPDSQWLVFNTFRDVDDPILDERDTEGSRGLWVIRADGSDVHPLHRTDGWRVILSPTWSPDSSVVLYVESLTVESLNSPRGVFSQGSLFASDVQESQAVPLKGLPEDEEAPSKVWWSPGGRYLYILKDGDTLGSYQSYHLTLTTK